MPLCTNGVSFDMHGNLQPHKLVSLTESEAFDILVTNFAPSLRRSMLWNQFQQYRIDMAKLLHFNAIQWIDGSYTTTKEHPGDIDVVTFIHPIDIQKNISDLKKFLTNFGSKDTYGIDGYIVPLFAPGDQYYDRITKERQEYWQNWFGHDRNMNPKGIVVLELEHAI